jgi:hypothetical protein
MRIQVITKENNTWDMKILTYDNPETVEVVTWKGMYKVDNKEPTSPLNCGEVKLMYPLIWYCRTMTSVSWRNTQQFNHYNVYYWDPVSKTWTDDDNIWTILIEWALKQDPEPDFDGAKEDKIEVEEVFSKM